MKQPTTVLNGASVRDNAEDILFLGLLIEGDIKREVTKCRDLYKRTSTKNQV